MTTIPPLASLAAKIRDRRDQELPKEIEMYEYSTLPELIVSTEAVIAYPIERGRTGVSVYVDCNPDDVSPDFIIDPADTEGIKIFREFAAKIAAHYKTLLNNKS